MLTTFHILNVRLNCVTRTLEQAYVQERGIVVHVLDIQQAVVTFFIRESKLCIVQLLAEMVANK